jgi:acyl carrier protein
MDEKLIKIAKRVISETFSLPVEQISIEDNLTEDLAADSIVLFELIVRFEKILGIEADYNDLIKIVTVNDIVDYLKKLEVNPEEIEKTLDSEVT